MESANHPQPPERPVVIACRVMEPEMEAARAGSDAIEIVYLEQGLHRTPKRLPELLQEQIDLAVPRASLIVLGYGLCSNGMVGVTARRQELIVPRCHDCISLFLGSPGRYLTVFNDHPGTYYLTPGWVKENQDPLGTYEMEYLPRYGKETALWAIRESLKNYTHIALINSGMPGIEALRRRAHENAAFLNMTYIEFDGNLSYFERILRGPYNDGDFLHLQPGETITQAMFLT
jgi:hypothetical protein